MTSNRPALVAQATSSVSCRDRARRILRYDKARTGLVPRNRSVCAPAVHGLAIAVGAVIVDSANKTFGGRLGDLRRDHACHWLST
jgi:hypothetical protein